MNVYDFAPDLDLSKEVGGSIFGVKGIGGSDGIIYACDRCIFYDCYKDTGCHRGGGVGGALG